MSKYFFDIEEREEYSPHNHAGTFNKYIINKDTFGSEHIDLILGEIHPGGDADKHAHDDFEQGMFILEGTGIFEIGDEVKEIGPGTCVFIPKGASHYVKTTSDIPMKFILVYSPARHNFK